MTYVMASARHLQILIGDDSQDWSEFYTLFQVGYSQRDESGIIFTRGNLTLGMPQQPPDTMNTRSKLGRKRWFKGQKVIVNVRMSDGTLERHPCGYLYILKPPTSWSPGNQFMDIELGCELSLRNFKQPDEILLKKPEGAIDRTAAIGLALKKAGVKGSWVGTVPKYPIPFAITKDGTSNVELAGKVAYGGISMIAQNNQGQIISVNAAMLPKTPVFTMRVGSEEISYQPVNDCETPSEKVKFTGVQMVMKRREKESTTITREYGPASLIDSELGDGEILMKLITTTDRVDPQAPAARVTTREVLAPLHLVSAVAFEGQTGLGLESHSVTSYYYDLGAEGKLSRVEEQEQKLFPNACSQQFELLSEADQGGFLGRIDSRNAQTSYNYSINTGVIQSTSTLTREPVSAIAPDDEWITPAALAPSEAKLTTWTKVFQEEWKKEESVSVSLARLNPESQAEPKTKVALTTKSSEVTISNSGQAQPPATDYRPKLYEQEEKLVKATAQFKDYSNPNEPRTRTFSLDIGCAGPGQLSDLARLEGNTLIGRALGQEIQCAFREELCEHPEPLSQWNVLELEIAPQGERTNLVYFLADGIQYTHDTERGVVGCSGIHLAIQEGSWQPYGTAFVDPVYSSEEAEAPYESVFVDAESTEAITIESPILPPETLEIAAYFGLGLGLKFGRDQDIYPTVIESRFGLGFGCSFDVQSTEDALFGFGLGYSTTTTISEPTPIEVTLTYSSIDDTNGMFYAIGTNFGTTAWSNPITSGKVTASQSSYDSDPNTANPAALVSRVNTDAWSTDPYSSHGSVEFDFGAEILNVTAYTLRRENYYPELYPGSGGWAPRSWVIEVSKNAVSWTYVDFRSNQNMLMTPGYGVFNVTNPTTGYFRYIRIRQTNWNAETTAALALGEVEFYGKLLKSS